MAAPTNRIPVRVARGSRAVLDSSLADIQEGELVFARDQDSLYVKDNGVLVNVAIGIGVSDFMVSAQIEWTVGLLPDVGYVFSGQGFQTNVPNPTIYVMRGQKYKFNHQLASDPFRITTIGDTSYDVGIQNNPADNSILYWEVSMEAPTQLKYVSEDNPEYQGTIVVLSDTFQMDLQELDDVSSVDPLNGQVLIYSTATGLWEPANLASGGAVTLGALTDVSVPAPAVNEVLRYDGSVWTASPEAGGPENTGRKTAIGINYSRTDQMDGTEFPLETRAEFEAQGWNVNSNADEGRAAQEWGTEGSQQEVIGSTNFKPLGRSDSTPANDKWYIDGSGRVISILVFDAGMPVVAATKQLSVPEVVAFAFVPFLEETVTTLDIWGWKTNVLREGKSWTIIRAEYSQPGGKKMAVEHWWTDEGDIKMMYGRRVNDFYYEVATNRNGFVFGSRSTDDSIGQVNTDMPLLTGGGDYVLELWVKGIGYMVSDLVDVASADVFPARRGQQLTWVGNEWAPGSNVEVGSQASTSNGQVGLFSIDDTYLYVAVGDNEWKRITLENFE